MTSDVQSSFVETPSSQFTYRHLHLLRNFSTRTPLRVIAHIDLDAFYAQCEMVRLDIARDQPLAVQQWGSLIAVNYAARPYGISRMISAKEAKRLCPQLLTPHVATFREGEGENWSYRTGDNSVETDKVSLDPYRTESRKILSVMRATLMAWAEGIDVSCRGESKSRVRDPADMFRLEKGGIDEVFVDLSALVYGKLMERFEMLRDDADISTEEGYEEAKRNLPKLPTTVLTWGKDDELVDLDTGESEEDDPDWDDIVMLIGSEITKAVRRAVWEQLRYTCSGGIGRNKMISKLGSACNKPNKQTIVRDRAIQQFLSGYKFTKIRMLGGKLGKLISSTFETEKVSDLLAVPVEQLKSKLDDDTGTWLYELIRGDEYSEVNPRTDIKSMLSAKSFRPGIKSLEQAEKWLRIFVADIYGRLIEEGVLENKRRPTVIAIHHRYQYQTRSRQIPIPTGKAVDQALLFDLAITLLHQVISDGNMWPCVHLSLTVSGFESGVTRNLSLDAFFTRSSDDNSTQKRDDASTLVGDAEPIEHDAPRKSKKQKVETGEADFSERDYNYMLEGDYKHGRAFNEEQDFGATAKSRTECSTFPSPSATQYTCTRCGKAVSVYTQSEHEDWHMAKDLEQQERRSSQSFHGHATGRKRQTRLAFG